jgi:hypothetical protein
LVPKDRPVVAYCAVGWRSSALAEKLKAQGYTNVGNLEGLIEMARSAVTDRAKLLDVAVKLPKLSHGGIAGRSCLRGSDAIQ